MSALSFSVPHPFTKADAVAKLTSFLSGVREKYKETASDIEGTWNDNILKFSMTVMGMAIKGNLTVEDNTAKLDLQYPLALAMFSGKIEQSVKSELEKALT